MSVSERHNAPAPVVLLSGTKFSVSRCQPHDRYSRRNSNLASVPNAAASNNYTGILGSPAAPRHNGGPSSLASSTITTDVHAPYDLDEISLNEQYLAFRVVLDTRDPKDKQQLNKPNPKLLRLTPTQLYQLSTDVFDELIRRQAPSSPNGRPAFLLPNNAFSSTRNQTRQRLSAVGSPRFRDLLADVAYEIKRRIPHLARAYLEQTGNQQAVSSWGSAGSVGSSVTKKIHNKLIEEYKSQLRQLSDKHRSMDDGMKDRGGEINGILGEERSRATTDNLEKQEWDDMQLDLENKLAEAQNLNDSMRQQLQQIQEDHDVEMERLRNEVASARTKAQEAQRVAAQNAAAQQISRGDIEPVELDFFLEQVNGRLGHSLLEQQQEQRQAMKEIRAEIKEFLRETRALSQQSRLVYERQAEELGQTTKRLEQEVHEWRIRYACAKEQLRSTCASSVELGPEHKGIKLDRGKGLVDAHGLVENIHVIEFQAAIDKLLYKARTHDSGSVIDAVKSVVASVRRIAHDAKMSLRDGEDSALQAKLRGEVSPATNSLIRASMNCAAGAGLYPLSLLNAAASRLEGAILDLLLLVEVQTTPAEDLEGKDGTAKLQRPSLTVGGQDNDHRELVHV
ncbi:hypothetical protein BHE90_009489 [Fusarium euwallaceae]|uniref:GIT Spa2 homology (SHD) domain-containing protein n=2 Tax=Fusarium solani species complex TaxID=232080 RepID=A0A430LJZ6_9HYPO|nr:hypothetical protein BHE90_009489 [Fusarium euwallaceae]